MCVCVVGEGGNEGSVSSEWRGASRERCGVRGASVTRVTTGASDVRAHAQ